MRRLKVDKGLTNKDLAEMAGCHPEYVSQLLNGRKEIPKYKRIVWNSLVASIEGS